MSDAKSIELFSALWAIVLIIWEIYVLLQPNKDISHEITAAILAVGIIILITMGIGFKLVLEKLEK